jgi:hypothetical protein
MRYCFIFLKYTSDMNIQLPAVGFHFDPFNFKKKMDGLFNKL